MALNLVLSLSDRTQTQKIKRESDDMSGSSEILTTDKTVPKEQYQQNRIFIHWKYLF